MKFTVSKDLRKNIVMRNLLIAFSIITLLFLALDITAKTLRFGASISEIKANILGNEEEFLEPLSMISALEILHLDLFLAIILLLMISSIFMRVDAKFKAGLLSSTMLFSIISFSSFFGALFFGELFVTISVVTFILWHLGAAWIVLISLIWLFKKQ